MLLTVGAIREEVVQNRKRAIAMENIAKMGSLDLEDCWGTMGNSSGPAQLVT